MQFHYLPYNEKKETQERFVEAMKLFELSAKEVSKKSSNLNKQFLYQCWLSKVMRIFYVTKDEKITGVCAFGITKNHMENGQIDAVMGSIYVLPECRGGDAFAILVARSIEAVKLQGAEKITVVVDVGHRLNSYAKKIGWKLASNNYEVA